MAISVGCRHIGIYLVDNLEPALTKELELLIEELECCSKLIKDDSPDFSAIFMDYAYRLRDVENFYETLNKFYQYVTHYKGLVDEQPANISTSTWTMIVERLKTSAIKTLNVK